MAKKNAEEVVETTEVVSNETIVAKKSNKKPLIAIICCVAVLVVGTLCFFGYKYFMGKNPAKVTSNAIRGLKDKIADAKDDNEEITKILEGKDPYEIKTNIEVKLPKELGVDDISLDVLAQIDSENQQGIGTVKALLGKQLVLDLSAALNEKDVYFKLNDTMSKYYKYNIEDALKEVDTTEFEKLAKIDYDGTKLIDYLADAFDKAYTKSDFDKEKTELTINEKDVKVTKYTAKVDGKKLDVIVDSFLTSVSKDKDLIKIIAELSGEDESDIKDAIKEVIDEDLSDEVTESFDYNVYVTTMGDAIGYGFAYENMEFTIADYKDVLSLQISGQGMTASLEFKEESDNHYVVTLDAMGMITGKIDIKSDLKTISKNKEYKETLTIDGSLSAMGQTYKASVKATSTIKKISEVDLSKTKGALDIENLTDAEMEEFETAVEKSALGKFISSLNYKNQLVENIEAKNYNY